MRDRAEVRDEKNIFLKRVPSYANELSCSQSADRSGRMRGGGGPAFSGLLAYNCPFRVVLDEARYIRRCLLHFCFSAFCDLMWGVCVGSLTEVVVLYAIRLDWPPCRNRCALVVFSQLFFFHFVAYFFCTFRSAVDAKNRAVNKRFTNH